MSIAARLLLRPHEPAPVRALARELGYAASSVSDALTRLRTAGLVDGQGRPAVPELFWELADRWPSAGADVATIPGPGRGEINVALRLGLWGDVESERGWALADTAAAAEYGAPLSVRAGHPADFYLPDGAVLRRAVHLLGRSEDHAGRAASVRVAPVPLVCDRRVDAASRGIGGSSLAMREWPLAQPLFVALDLAQDPGRGVEVLDHWTPPEPWVRVW